MLHWSRLNVVKADNTYMCTLGELMEGPSAYVEKYLEGIKSDSNGGIQSWDGYFICADGEDPSPETPLVEIDWEGFKEEYDNYMEEIY